MRMNVLAALLLASLVTATDDLPSVALEPVASGLTRPVSMAHAGDDRLFVVEQGGLIRVLSAGVLRPDPFLDVRSLVTSNGERGLLGLAFHPEYAQNGFFFVNYTDVEGDTVVARYTVSSTDPNRGDPTSARVVLRIDQPFANHNGGQLQFGPDGYLYIGMGDGGSGGDPGNRAQNLLVLLGKMLRIDVDALPYSIPPSNPFAMRDDSMPEIWASGLRNPWRFSFDRTSGDLWIADVGQGEWEEVSFQPASSIGGENYGWRRMEGTHCFNPPSACNDGTLVLPVIEYGHADGACSVTGGYVYRGVRSPRLAGMYLYADFCNGRIRGATRHASGVVTTQPLLDVPFLLSTFGEDSRGEIYVADYSNGIVYHLFDSRPVGSRRRAVRH
jgi:glucose/arabinose dehydrogenase